METDITKNHSDLLLKLTRLEDQVASLTQQLETDKSKIDQLQQLLSERDVEITDLQTKLYVAQNSLQPTLTSALAQCRELFKNGIDAKFINPILNNVQKTIDSVQQIIAEVKEFVLNRKSLLESGLGGTSDLIRHGPEQAKAYLNSNVLAPIYEMLDKVSVRSNVCYQQGRQWCAQEFDRSQNLSKQLVYLARELPLDAKVLLQTRIVDPVLFHVDRLPDLIEQYWRKTTKILQECLQALRKWFQALLDYLGEWIKKSSFWDGKQRMVGAT